ncbi:dde superfamily endonuclease [Holotrichia oblita]|uniref:Dde superfamily endonuclease n=1 Tax=Holotrichia oblita TaxID=644536 RepID=A0ACB9SQM0_HOLOL|nr:dde superfamily endonuclease [Holotrichia oblita]
MVFTHCHAGVVGSKNDATVLRNSEVWTYLIQVPDKFPYNSHLIGDKAYPCMSRLMTPYKDYGQMTRRQRNYNYQHSCARSVIARAFALLKGRFRKLKFRDVKSIDRMDTKIYHSMLHIA